MRKKLKKAVRRSLRRKHVDSQAIVIAGLGRCGTTLVYDALVKYGFAPGDMIERMEGFAGYEPGVVYKTHDFPPTELPSFVKMVFMFGNPMNTVLSAHRKINEWGVEHFHHLNSSKFVENTQLFECDALGLSEQFARWYRAQAFPFLSIRYEDLWSSEVQQALFGYLGFEFKLPGFRERKAAWQDDERAEQLQAVYGELGEQVKGADVCRLWS